MLQRYLFMSETTWCSRVATSAVGSNSIQLQNSKVNEDYSSGIRRSRSNVDALDMTVDLNVFSF